MFENGKKWRNQFLAHGVDTISLWFLIWRGMVFSHLPVPSLFSNLSPFFPDPQWINVDHLGCNNSHRCYHQAILSHGMLCCFNSQTASARNPLTVSAHVISLLLAVPAFLSCQTRCQRQAAGHKRFNNTIDVCFWHGFWYMVWRVRLLHMYPYMSYVEKNNNDNLLKILIEYWSLGNLFGVACHHQGVIGNFGFALTCSQYFLTCNETLWNVSLKKFKEDVSSKERTMINKCCIMFHEPKTSSKLPRKHQQKTVVPIPLGGFFCPILWTIHMSLWHLVTHLFVEERFGHIQPLSIPSSQHPITGLTSGARRNPHAAQSTSAPRKFPAHPALGGSIPSPYVRRRGDKTRFSTQKALGRPTVVNGAGLEVG